MRIRIDAVPVEVFDAAARTDLLVGSLGLTDARSGQGLHLPRQPRGLGDPARGLGMDLG
ncbi:hypothetical protein ACFY3M_50030 [Streptomyces mirabilis]|uniref:hypothetical protein n=1 Tax=Streptomyces mirabilis TaxID=68239 RepID=UPI00368DD57A